MHARLVAVVAVLWGSLAIFATGSGQVAPSVAPPAKPFSHKEHVAKSWLGPMPEVFRDCRGCHRFAANNEFSTPQAECDNCHTGGGLEHQFAAGWQQDLSGYASRTQPAFRHHTHGMLECRQCHLPRDEFLDDHMPIRTGPGLCAECHDDTVTAADLGGWQWFGGLGDDGLAKAVGLSAAFDRPATAAAQQAYAEKLASVFSGPKGGININPLPPGGDFDHADHIDTTGSGVTGIDCATCHTNIQKASAAEVGTGQIPVDGCKQCHVRNAGGAAARAAQAVKKEERPLWALGTFAHGDHFGFLAPATQKKDGVCNAKAYADVEQQACKACHRYAPETPGFSERDFPFRDDGSRHRYGDCVVCHDADGWQTGETAAAPLHASTGGDGTGWRQCAECHVLGEPDMAKVRPMVEVQRWTERTFVFEGNTHPDITSRGVQRSTDKNRPVIKDCKTCHRAVVPELPTRLIEKVFRHDTHLPPNAEQANCVACHPLAEQAATSVALSGADFRTYTMDSCKLCHWGGEVTERVAANEKPAARQAVRFPHGPHVQKHAQSCVECHELGVGGQDIATKAESAACNQCHDHVDGDNDSTYEGLFDGRAESCARCHHEDRGNEVLTSIPPSRGSEAAATDARYRSLQSVFAGFRDSQFHPLGQACSECHTANLKTTRLADGTERKRPAAILRYPNDDHLLAVKNVSVHAPPPKGTGQSAPSDCLRCHWKPVGSWAAAAGAAKVIPGDREDARQLRLRPDGRDTRDRYGNLFAGYPGTERADG